MNRYSLKKKGFSLVEILVVIGILGILLGIGIPYFLRSKARQQLKIDASTLRSSLEQASSKAKSAGREDGDDGSDVEMVFKGSGNTVTGFEIKDTTGRVINSYTFGNGITADITNITTPLQFKGNGTITTSGDIIVRSNALKDSWKITLVSTTGLIKFAKN